MATFTATFRAFADYSSAIAEGKKLGRSFSNAAQEAKGAGDAGRLMAEKVGAATQKVTLAQRNAEAATRRVRLAELNLDQVRQRGKATQLQMETAENRLTTARDRAKTANERLARSQKLLQDAQNQTRASGRDLFFAAAKSAENFGRSMSIGVTAPLTLLGVTATRTFAEFEKRIVAAGSKSDATAAQLEEMKRVAMDTAAQTKFSATEAADGLDILAAAGFSAHDAIATLPAVTKAAQAQNADLGLTAEVTAKAMNAFNIPVANAAHVADVFTQAANTTTLDMQQLKDALGQVGEVGPRFGQSLEDVVAVTGRLADLGVPAASAGTAIRQALTFLSGPTNRAANLMELLGINVRQANGDMKALPDLLEEVDKGLSSANPQFADLAGITKLSGKELQNFAKQNGLTVAQANRLSQAVQGGDKSLRDYAMRTLFGVEGAKAFSLAVSDGKPVIIDTTKEQDKLRKVTTGLAQVMGVDAANAFVKAHTNGDQFTATGTDAVRVVAALGRQSQGTADRVAAMFQKTTAQRAENFKGALEALAITAIDRVSPALNQILSDLTDFVAMLTDLSREQPTLTRFAIGFGVVAASIGPVLFAGGKLIGLFRSIRGVTSAVGGALQTAGTYLELYGEQATLAGRKVRGGFLGGLGKVTTFLGGPWGAAIGLGVTLIGGLITAHRDAAAATKTFTDALDFENGKLAENSRSTLANQLAHEGVLKAALDAGVSEQDFTEALIQGGPARQAMLDHLRQIQHEGEKYTQTGYTTTLTISDQSKAASTAADALASMGTALDTSARQAQEAANASANAADTTNALSTAASGAHPWVQMLATDADTNKNSYAELNKELGKTAANFTILKGLALDQSEANDAYKGSLDALTTSVKGNRDALQAQVDKGKLSAAAARERATAITGDTAAAIANRDAIREQVKKLNDKVTADYQAKASAGDYVGAQKLARAETIKGRDELIKHAEKAGLDKAAVRKLIDSLIDVPGAVHVDMDFSTNADKVLVKLRAKWGAAQGRTKGEQALANSDKNVAATGGLLAGKGSRIQRVIKRATGGRIPSRTGAGGPQQDLVMGINRETGRHEVDVSPREFVVNAAQTDKNLGAIQTINSGGEWDVVPRRARGGKIGDSDVPKRVLEIGPEARRYAARTAMGAARGYAAQTQKTLQGYLNAAEAAAGGGGGPIGPGSYVTALRFARSQVGKPYVFGAAGPGGYDCSGFMAALQNVIEGKNPYHRRYSTPAFHGAHAMGFTRNKRSPFMVGVNPNPGRSGHMAGTLNGVNVESAGGVGVRVGGRARGWNNPMFSWRGGLAGGGLIPGVNGDLPYDTVNPRGQRFNRRIAEIAKAMYGAQAYARGTTRTGHLTLAGEHGAELLRTRTGSEVMSSARTLDYLSRIEALAVNAPADLAGRARAAGAVRGNVAVADRPQAPVTLNMPMTYVPEEKLPTMAAQQQIVRAGRSIRRVDGQG